MNIDFAQVMSQRNDEELIKIVTLQRADYQIEAVCAAEAEIKKRGISADTIESIKAEIVVHSVKQVSLIEGTVNSMVRLVHMIVDFLAFALLALILSIVVDLLTPTQNQSTIPYFGVLLFIASYFFYYIFFEFKYQKTLGKLLTKTVVVSKDGKQLMLSDIITRTVCRLIPFDPVSYVFTKNGFHDYLSNTTVIKEKLDTNIV